MSYLNNYIDFYANCYIHPDTVPENKRAEIMKFNAERYKPTTSNSSYSALDNCRYNNSYPSQESKYESWVHAYYDDNSVIINTKYW